MPGEVVRPVSAARSGCATAPSLTPLRSAKPRTACSVAAAVQGSTASSAGMISASSARASGVSSAAALSSSASGRAAQMKLARVDQLDQRLGALLQFGHGGHDLLADRGRQLGGDLGAVRQMRQQPVDRRQQLASGLVRM